MSIQVFKHEGKGQPITIYDEINITGKLYLVIRSENGLNNAELWWILKPWGSVRQLGIIEDEAVLDIPSGWLPPVFGSTLRCRCKPERTVIYLSANEQVDKTVTFKW